MSSTSIIEPGQAVAESGSPSPHGDSRRKLGEWFLSRLDLFLSEPLRRAPPEELGRYRVLVGISCVLLALNSVTLLLLASSDQPWLHASVIGFASLGVGTALVLLRRRASHELSALLVCSSITLAFMFNLLARKDPHSASHAAGMLIPGLLVYLVGARLGLLITVPMALCVGLLHPLYFISRGLLPPTMTPAHLWRVDISAAISMVGIWVVSWLHANAREKAHAAREQALRTLRESERKLNSLIENTEDLVCSLDAEGRFVLANSAMRQAFRARYGKEPVPGEPLIPREPARGYEAWQQRLAQAFSGQRVRVEESFALGGRVYVTDISFHPIFSEDGQPLGLNLFGRDITERKEAETKLSEMHRTLLDVSRQAGMAEVATGLLHNVGNTLNSVNVSANLVTQRLRNSRLVGFTRAAELLREHSGDVCTFLSTDPRGRQLPAYLVALSEQLVEEQQALLAEQRTLTECLDHVKSIVSMQQEHARFSGVVELVSVSRLIDDALRLHAATFERLGITIYREYSELPPTLVDRHKLLQILINLLSNARHALLDDDRPDKRLTIRISLADGARLRIQVSDNGVGIPREHRARIFSQGFTTKKDGHGFGLHISALAAAEMAGSLTCESEGPGQGATFTIELPVARHEEPRG